MVFPISQSTVGNSKERFEYMQVFQCVCDSVCVRTGTRDFPPELVAEVKSDPTLDFMTQSQQGSCLEVVTDTTTGKTLLQNKSEFLNRHKCLPGLAWTGLYLKGHDRPVGYWKGTHGAAGDKEQFYGSDKRISIECSQFQNVLDCSVQRVPQRCLVMQELLHKYNRDATEWTNVSILGWPSQSLDQMMSLGK